MRNPDDEADVRRCSNSKKAMVEGSKSRSDNRGTNRAGSSPKLVQYHAESTPLMWTSDFSKCSTDTFDDLVSSKDVTTFGERNSGGLAEGNNGKQDVRSSCSLSHRSVSISCQSNEIDLPFVSNCNKADTVNHAHSISRQLLVCLTTQSALTHRSSDVILQAAIRIEGLLIKHHTEGLVCT